MDKFAENLEKILKAFSPYIYLVVAIGLAVTLLMCCIPSGEVQAKARKLLPSIFFGGLGLSGVVYLAKWYCGLITF